MVSPSFSSGYFKITPSLKVCSIHCGVTLVHSETGRKNQFNKFPNSVTISKKIKGESF